MGNQADFTQYVETVIFPAILGTLKHKGSQYAPDGDALENFKEPAEQVEMSPAHYLMTQAQKQWFVVFKWSKIFRNKNARELMHHRDIINRIADVVVYLFLLLYMIKEKFGDDISCRTD